VCKPLAVAKWYVPIGDGDIALSADGHRGERARGGDAGARRRPLMRLRIVAATVVAASLTLVAAASTSARTEAMPSAAKATTLTVWLMEDARDNWGGVVNSATNAFEASHADVDVKVEYQTWGSILTKLDASLQARRTPDVVELGNSQMSKYMAAGAFRQIVPRNYPNYATWLPGLKASCTYRGRTYCVPYYAGARAVIYRKDYYRAAGITKTPKSLAEFVAAGQKLNRRYRNQQGFSALYMPGKYWYAAMSFVYDHGGAISRFRGGRYVGTLDSPQAIAGLTSWKNITRSLSKANRSGDENNPEQAIVFSKGRVASFIGNGWEWPHALNPKTGNPSIASQMGAYPMPSRIKGRFLPSFLGGSDLGIPVFTQNAALAADWIKAFTSTASMQRLATEGKVIPNTTRLANINARNPQLAPFAAAAKYSWFVPTSPNWVNVESANVLQNMLVSIVTNRATVRAAAKRASQQITKILNESS
jgi:N,N'-diacetylchitobiose transport system substrate-binding protein